MSRVYIVSLIAPNRYSPARTLSLCASHWDDGIFLVDEELRSTIIFKKPQNGAFEEQFLSKVLRSSPTNRVIWSNDGEG